MVMKGASPVITKLSDNFIKNANVWTIVNQYTGNDMQITFDPALHTITSIGIRTIKNDPYRIYSVGAGGVTADAVLSEGATVYKVEIGGIGDLKGKCILK